MNNLEFYKIIHHHHKDTFHLSSLIQLLQNNSHILFMKYGDGEVECMKVSDTESNSYGQNCDSDVYYPDLSLELKSAFLYFVNESLKKDVNIHIGKWHFHPEIDYLSTYYFNQNSPNIKTLIPFTNYHLVMNDKNGLTNKNMYTFVKTLKENNNYTKIVISNPQNILLQSLFSAQYFVNTPDKCLYLSIDSIYDNIDIIINNEKNKNIMLLTSCGLSAKIIIYHFFKKYGIQVSAIDIGSSFDLLCKKRVTRSYQIEYSYEDIYNYYEDLLPFY
jgi:hypothetical protein